MRRLDRGGLAQRGNTVNTERVTDLIGRLLDARAQRDRTTLMTLLSSSTTMPPEDLADLVAGFARHFSPRLPRHEAGFVMLPPGAADRLPPPLRAFLRMAAALGNEDPGLARDLGVGFIHAGGWPARSQLLITALNQCHHLRTCEECAGGGPPW